MCDLPDYRDNAIAYEVEENNRPDEMLMIHTMGAWASVFLDFNPRCVVLDLCCGTGLSMLHTAGHHNAIKVVGVDVSPNYLQFNRERFAKAENRPELHHGDAVDFLADKVHCYDVVTLASAYHHIEDDRKILFLQRVKRSLSGRGRAFFAENILPEYDASDRRSYCEAVSRFYKAVLADARRANPHLDAGVEGLIWRVAQYGFDADFEYKVSKSVFDDHLRESGLEVELCARVWPNEGQGIGDGGNYVIQAR